MNASARSLPPLPVGVKVTMTCTSASAGSRTYSTKATSDRMKSSKHSSQSRKTLSRFWPAVAAGRTTTIASAARTGRIMPRTTPAAMWPFTTSGSRAWLHTVEDGAVGRRQAGEVGQGIEHRALLGGEAVEVHEHVGHADRLECGDRLRGRKLRERGAV